MPCVVRHVKKALGIDRACREETSARHEHGAGIRLLQMSEVAKLDFIIRYYLTLLLSQMLYSVLFSMIVHNLIYFVSWVRFVYG